MSGYGYLIKTKDVGEFIIRSNKKLDNVTTEDVDKLITTVTPAYMVRDLESYQEDLTGKKFHRCVNSYFSTEELDSFKYFRGNRVTSIIPLSQMDSGMSLCVVSTRGYGGIPTKRVVTMIPTLQLRSICAEAQVMAIYSITGESIPKAFQRIYNIGIDEMDTNTQRRLSLSIFGIQRREYYSSSRIGYADLDCFNNVIKIHNKDKKALAQTDKLGVDLEDAREVGLLELEADEGIEELYLDNWENLRTSSLMNLGKVFLSFNFDKIEGGLQLLKAIPSEKQHKITVTMSLDDYTTYPEETDKLLDFLFRDSKYKTYVYEWDRADIDDLSFKKFYRLQYIDDLDSRAIKALLSVKGVGGLEQDERHYLIEETKPLTRNIYDIFTGMKKV